MGVFSKIKKTVKGIAKNPTNFKNYADLGLQSLSFGQIDTNGVNGVGSLEDVLLGKKQKDIQPDDIANQIRATQSRGIGELNAALDTPAEDVVREQVTREKAGVLSGAQDARRNAQRMIAQTGLKGSSLGLGLERSITQDTTNNLGSIDARIPGAIRNQKIADATTRIGVGGVNQNGMNFHTIQGQREGGLLGYASAAAPLLGGIGQAMGGVAALKRANAGGANTGATGYAGGGTGDYSNWV